MQVFNIKLNLTPIQFSNKCIVCEQVNNHNFIGPLLILSGFMRNTMKSILSLREINEIFQ